MIDGNEPAGGEPGHSCPHCEDIAELREGFAKLGEAVEQAASSRVDAAEETVEDAMDVIFGGESAA